MKNKIIIISGDPNSVNSEIIYKTWKKLNKKIKKQIYFISNLNLLKKQFNALKYNVNLIKVPNISFKVSSHNDIKIVDQDLNFKGSPFKIPKEKTSKFIIKSLNYAHEAALNRKDVKGIINLPINKNIFNKKIGVTEYLSSKCKVKTDTEVMLINNEKLSVCPVTTHLDLKDVSKMLNKKKIIKKVKTIDKWFKKYKKIKPKIAILGLNPHNAELRKNSEEKKIIIPALKSLKKIGADVHGPFSADTIFINEYKNFDIIIGMYHDQILSPYKSLFKFNAINLTLGLDYLRVSPDHGVGLNIIKKNKASYESLMKCISFINTFKK